MGNSKQSCNTAKISFLPEVYETREAMNPHVSSQASKWWDAVWRSLCTETSAPPGQSGDESTDTPPGLNCHWNSWLRLNSNSASGGVQKNKKRVLTNKNRSAILQKLSRKKAVQNLDNWTVKQPWKFLKSFFRRNVSKASAQAGAKAFRGGRGRRRWSGANDLKQQ